jgi:hypothetical protein
MMELRSGDWLCAHEIAQGFAIVRPGEAAWLPLEDWHPFSIASTDGKRVRLVALQAQHEGEGALRRCIAAIRAARLQPVIVEPFDRLEQSLKRWGWRHRRLADANIWYPR